MARLINGCQEGKGTLRLTEVKCPKCGEYVEVFVQMGGAIGKTGACSQSYRLSEGYAEVTHRESECETAYAP